MNLRKELGIVGAGALVLLSLSLAFSMAVVDPLEKRAARLEGKVQLPKSDLLRVSAHRPADQLAQFYRFFERPERVDDWLARLYALATASGLELRAGEYRLADDRRRIERYSITLPVNGSYAQVRAFLEAALAEIPVLSLDQVTFRRKGANEPRLEAEVILTLHLTRK